MHPCSDTSGLNAPRRGTFGPRCRNSNAKSEANSVKRYNEMFYGRFSLPAGVSEQPACGRILAKCHAARLGLHAPDPGREPDDGG